MNLRNTAVVCCALIGLLSAGELIAGGYTLAWSTFDGGGVIASGDGFKLSGTIAQADAGVANEGASELLSGFWSVTTLCTCPGDVNHDGVGDGRDVEHFVACLLADDHCVCADADGIGGPSVADIPPFVSSLLAGDCP